MTISEQQKQQVLNNFYLLCDNFLPSLEVRTKIKIVFQEQELEGKTFFKFQDKSFIISF